MPKHRLSKMRIDRVSLVDRPAHPDAEVVIAKRDESEDNLERFDKNTSSFVEPDMIHEDTSADEIEKEMDMGDEMHDDHDGSSKKKARKMPQEVLDHFKGVSKSEEDELVLEDMDDAVDFEYEEDLEKFDELLAELPAEVVEYIEKLEDTVIDLAKEDDEDELLEEDELDVEDEMKKEDDDELVLEDEDLGLDDDEVEKFLKSADPRLADIVKSAVDRAEAAETIAKRERDLRLEKEFIAKAEDLSHLPAKSDEVVALLKAVHTGAPRAAGAFEELLKRCNSAMAEGDIYKSEGQDESYATSSAVARWDSAVEAVRKSDDSLSYEQAFASALDQNPDLYEEYLTGKGH